MSYKAFRIIVWLAFFTLPMAYHLFDVYMHARGGYDGKHCAGLLDAQWECTEFEYYIDWAFNGFAMIGLLGAYLIALPITIIILFVGRKAIKQTA